MRQRQIGRETREGRETIEATRNGGERERREEGRKEETGTERPNAVTTLSWPLTSLSTLPSRYCSTAVAVDRLTLLLQPALFRRMVDHHTLSNKGKGGRQGGREKKRE